VYLNIISQCCQLDNLSKILYNIKTIMALDQTFLNEVVALSGPEAGELAQLLSKKWGIELPSATTAVATTTPTVAGEDALVSITLKAYPADKKMIILKIIKDILGLGLMEAKAFVEAAPKLVKADLEKQEAEKIKKSLIDAGAELEIK
jgi:large subunit ribosomal protein L7/L12